MTPKVIGKHILFLLKIYIQYIVFIYYINNLNEAMPLAVIMPPQQEPYCLIKPQCQAWNASLRVTGQRNPSFPKQYVLLPLLLVVSLSLKVNPTAEDMSQF